MWAEDAKIGKMGHLGRPSRVGDWGNLLEPSLNTRAHVSIASLLGLLLAMVMEIWYRERGPFWPIFAVLPIFCHVGITISPCVHRPSQEESAIIVAFEQRSIALCFHICFFDVVGDMQHLAIAMLCHFAYVAVLCPIP